MIKTAMLSKHLAKLPGFIAVAESGSFSKAAILLSISQPALSQSIQILESALDLQLFVRTQKGTSLSDSGKKLYAFCKRILNECDQFDHTIQIKEPLQFLVLGTKDPFAIHLWPSYFNFFQKHLWEMKIDIISNNSNTDLLKLLHKKKVDLIMISNPIAQDGLLVHEIFRTNYSIYINSKKEHQTTTKMPLFIFSNAIATGSKTIGQILGKKLLEKYEVRNVDSFEVARAMCMSGLGAAILPRFIGERDYSSGLLHEALSLSAKPFGILSVCICFREGDERAFEFRTFIRRLKDAHKNI